ncbi:MAG: sigma-70 family RNA polymerase sigma factor [Chloroflexi bacterium]|nr:sigma-70 family RNA polymerase sigma factor [Chloroflexota bacterium]
MAEISALQTIKHWLGRERNVSIVDAVDFARLYDQNYLGVFRYVYGLCSGIQQEAEDITAETFMRAWITRHRFSGSEQAVLGWLLYIARNLVIDTSRRRKVRAVDDSVELESLPDVNDTPEADLIGREQTETLLNMLASLPEEMREILVLRYILNWQVKQIAIHLGMNENNVSVCIRRTINRLQRNWKQS